MILKKVNTENTRWFDVKESKIWYDAETKLLKYKVNAVIEIESDLGIWEEREYSEYWSYRIDKIYGFTMVFSEKEALYYVILDVPESCPFWFETESEARDFVSFIENLMT